MRHDCSIVRTVGTRLLAPGGYHIVVVHNVSYNYGSTLAYIPSVYCLVTINHGLACAMCGLMISLAGGIEGFQFSDIRKSGRVGSFASEGAEWNTLKPGMAYSGTCCNKYCEANGHTVHINRG
jgi:hypothetical protein